METDFTALEIQLIRSSLATRTNEELAALLERPVEEVIAKIDEITGGSSEDRQRDVVKHQEERSLEKENKKRQAERKTARKLMIRDNETRKEKRKKEAESRRNIEEKRNQEKRYQAQERSYKTRQIDYTQMVKVIIDKSTFIYVKKGDNIKEARDRYIKLREKQTKIV